MSVFMESGKKARGRGGGREDAFPIDEEALGVHREEDVVKSG